MGDALVVEKQLFTLLKKILRKQNYYEHQWLKITAYFFPIDHVSNVEAFVFKTAIPGLGGAPHGNSTCHLMRGIETVVMPVCSGRI